jgi:hypothetical protein
MLRKETEKGLDWKSMAKHNSTAKRQNLSSPGETAVNGATANVEQKPVVRPKLQVGQVGLRMSPELKRMLDIAAYVARIPTSELCVRILAAHFKRTDLAKVPRDPRGKRPVEVSAEEYQEYQQYLNFPTEQK